MSPVVLGYTAITISLMTFVWVIVADRQSRRIGSRVDRLVRDLEAFRNGLFGTDEHEGLIGELDIRVSHLEADTKECIGRLNELWRALEEERGRRADLYELVVAALEKTHSLQTRLETIFEEWLPVLEDEWERVAANHPALAEKRSNLREELEEPFPAGEWPVAAEDGDAPRVRPEDLPGEGPISRADVEGSGLEFGRFRKTIPVRAVRISGPFEVDTREGTLECEDGYLALDSEGYPYPIAREEFEEIYAPDRPPEIAELASA